MTEVVEVVRTERVVIERLGGIEVVEVAFQGPPGPEGPPGASGVFTGVVADASPDPLLLFENALI